MSHFPNSCVCAFQSYCALVRSVGLAVVNTFVLIPQGLKNHAVTMFEVGKMADESLDSFLLELEQISWNDGEGEAQRYFEHAKTLKRTILFLRNNPHLGSMTLDLLRCESLLNLDSVTLSRLLNKNYS